jgi:hypothetical protein
VRNPLSDIVQVSVRYSFTRTVATRLITGALVAATR